MLVKESPAKNDEDAGDIGEKVNVAALFEVFKIVMCSTA